ARSMAAALPGSARATPRAAMPISRLPRRSSPTWLSVSRATVWWQPRRPVRRNEADEEANRAWFAFGRVICPVPACSGRARLNVARITRFTIAHGLAVSLVLHAAFGVPVVMYGFVAEPDEQTPLVVQLEGVMTDRQSEQAVLEQVKGAASSDP